MHMDKTELCPQITSLEKFVGYPKNVRYRPMVNKVHALRADALFFLFCGGVTLAAAIGTAILSNHNTGSMIVSTILAGSSIVLLREASLNATEAIAIQEVAIENRILDLTYNLG